MQQPPPPQVTDLLVRWRGGDAQALQELTPLVYAELRRIARIHLSRERDGHTLQPTALVHEAFLRLAGQGDHDWQSRAHFVSVASSLMRQVLVDHARRRQAAKRSGGQTLLLKDHLVGEPPKEVLILALHDALDGLSAVDSRKSRMVEMRFFGGLTGEEISHVLGISTATVQREMRMAEAWLARELSTATT